MSGAQDRFSTALLDGMQELAPKLALGEFLNADFVHHHCDKPGFVSLLKRLGFAFSDSGKGWQKMKQPIWHLGWARTSDAQAWLDLFHKSFGHTMAESMMRWKYHATPVMGVAAYKGQDMVAFYGGMPKRVSFCGQPEMAVQIGDVMVSPTERGILTRHGPFQMVASTFLEQCIGYDKPHLVGYGFPSEKALTLASKLGLYATVDSVVELSWRCGATTPKAPWYWSAQPLESFDALTVDKLWNDMRSAMTASIVGVRDWTYIQHRYLEHPVQRYTCLLVRNRLTRRAVGLLVLRDLGEQGMELSDVLAPPKRMLKLVKVASEVAQKAGRARLMCWITKSQAHWLKSADTVENLTEIRIPANVWSPGPGVDVLKDRWWLMGGDTDFR